MSAYEELVGRCQKVIFDAPSVSSYADLSVLILAEVLRTLETVTPEMVSASQNALAEHIKHLPPSAPKTSWIQDGKVKSGALIGHDEKHELRILAALRASPLAPPK